MKKLLLSLLFINSLVQAEILATAPNRANGLMYFTDTHCSGKGAYWKVIYSTFNGGSTTFGCWIYDSGMIHILWSDTQSTIVIPASDLTLVNKGKDI
jgi:hypothetical protein